MLNTAISQSSNTTATPQEEEEEDNWLNIDAQDFDDMLERTMGSSKTNVHGLSNAMEIDGEGNENTEEDRLANEQASRLQDLAQKVESFVERKGDVDGAKFEEYVISPIENTAFF